jgi:hypothetical protein
VPRDGHCTANCTVQEFPGPTKKPWLAHTERAPTVHITSGERVMASLRRRGKKYYASYYVGGKEHRRALATSFHQAAKERLRNMATMTCEVAYIMPQLTGRR